MNQQPNRIGRFTSSKIVALTKKGKAAGTFGAPALNYIQEKKFERRLGRSLSQDVTAKPLQWGNLCEQIAFDALGLEYNLISKVTIDHPILGNYWSGSPDGTKIGVVYDIKCTITLKSFCEFYDCETKEDLINNTTDGEKYYWQLVSNAILTNTDKAELIIFCPYLSQLPTIRQAAEENNINWIKYSTDNELPYLLDNGNYKNIKVISFDISEEDKDLLTSCVNRAIQLL